MKIKTLGMGFRNRILQSPLFTHKINYEKIQKTVTFEFLKVIVLFQNCSQA